MKNADAKPGIQRVFVNTHSALRLTDEILKSVLNGHDHTECEVALLLAYCAVSHGVAAYPTSSKPARISMFVEKAGEELCRLVDEIAEVPDGDLRLMPISQDKEF